MSVRSHRACTTKKGEQNRKLAKRTIVITTATLFPWLPNLVMSIAMRILSKQDPFHPFFQTDLYFSLNDAVVYLYYTVPWVFPLIHLIFDPYIAQGKQQLFSSRYGSYYNNSNHGNHGNHGDAQNAVYVPMINVNTPVHSPNAVHFADRDNIRTPIGDWDQGDDHSSVGLLLNVDANFNVCSIVEEAGSDR
eukprot:sb/3471107/